MRTRIWRKKTAGGFTAYTEPEQCRCGKVLPDGGLCACGMKYPDPEELGWRNQGFTVDEWTP